MIATLPTATLSLRVTIGRGLFWIGISCPEHPLLTYVTPDNLYGTEGIEPHDYKRGGFRTVRNIILKQRARRMI